MVDLLINSVILTVAWVVGKIIWNLYTPDVGKWEPCELPEPTEQEQEQDDDV